jgi:hypothetical protein
LVAGSLAGVAAYCVVYPIDVTKTMLSINFIPQGYSLIDSMRYIKSHHGISALYKGLGATCCVI